jgi:hypothetical protein
MPNRPLSPEVCQQTLDAFKQHGTEVKAAKALGISRGTFHDRHRTAQTWAAEHKPLPLDTKPFLKRIRGEKRGRYVITSAQNATDVHAPFLAALQQYCRRNRAQLIVIPYRYRNPTSMWGEKAKDEDFWAPEVAPFLLDQRFDLNRNITVLADIKTQPTAVNPLSGFETITGARSAVLAHPKIEMVVVPTPHNKLPKVLLTTGSVTKKNYTPTKAGKKGEFHHSLGAALIEVDGDVFYPRQINAMPDGSFIELDYEYTQYGSHPAPPAEGVVMGDSHVVFIDPGVVDATFGKRGMLALLKPKKIVWHDVNDFYSGSHHHAKLLFTRYAKHLSGMDDIEGEVDKTFAFIDKYSPKGVVNVFAASNHPEHLTRWVRECEWRHDPKNILFASRTLTAMLESTRMTASGTETLDPFAYWAKSKLKCFKRSRFLRRDESCRIAGIEVGYHGDQGLNGARGSILAYSKIGAKTVIGHSHTPGIREGAYQVGTSSRLRLEYNHGPSSWLHTHCVIYANGKRSLLTVIDGKWRT